eukprot:Protomagalhaensia_sp_Gyna_25__5918@NODE_900_length_2441_cov_49_981682_g710_i0_p1_GENE_NODE_900_length_2441_cov_49_981682_g710_i0NODE_900_length_2441_cov_49_981682_g710_i0_p1_ORF_typecomplete_len453_score71_19CBF/PF03914_17/2_5e03CBF/PF03914_17/1_1e10_NODE_900_length_2441_cov_49_981682_g710_i08742232
MESLETSLRSLFQSKGSDKCDLKEALGLLKDFQSIEAPEVAREWISESKQKLVLFILHEFANKANHWETLINTLKSHWVLNHLLQGQAREFIWDTYGYIMQECPDGSASTDTDQGEAAEEFRPSFIGSLLDGMRKYMDFGEALIDGHLTERELPKDERLPITMELLDCLSSVKTQLMLVTEDGRTQPSSEEVDRYKTKMNKLFMMAIDSFESTPELAEFLGYLVQKSAQILPQLKNAVPLAIRLLKVGSESRGCFDLDLLVACASFDLILFHRFEFLGNTLEEAEGSDIGSLTDRFYQLLQPQLFSSPHRDEALSRLEKLSKILPQSRALLYFKKSMRVACLVPPHSAIWVVAFAKSLFLRHPQVLAGAIHINPSLRSELRASRTEMNKVLYSPTHLEAPSSTLPIPQYYKQASRLSALELTLLLRHHDIGVRRSATDFLGTILKEVRLYRG